jgi:multidrug efflux pump subunit AcrB
MLEIGMPPGYNFNLTGMAEVMQESFANPLFAFTLEWHSQVAAPLISAIRRSW